MGCGPGSSFAASFLPLRGKGQARGRRLEWQNRQRDQRDFQSAQKYRQILQGEADGHLSFMVYTKMKRKMPLVLHNVRLQELPERHQSFPHSQGLMGEVWKKHHWGVIEEDSVLSTGSTHDGLLNLEEVNPAKSVMDKGRIRISRAGGPMDTVQFNAVLFGVLQKLVEDGSHSHV